MTKTAAVAIRGLLNSQQQASFDARGRGRYQSNRDNRQIIGTQFGSEEDLDKDPWD